MPSPVAKALAEMIGGIKDIMPAHEWTQAEVTKLLRRMVHVAETHVAKAAATAAAAPYYGHPSNGPAFAVKKMEYPEYMETKYAVRVVLADGKRLEVAHAVSAHHGYGAPKHVIIHEVAKTLGHKLGKSFSDAIEGQIIALEQGPTIYKHHAYDYPSVTSLGQAQGMSAAMMAKTAVMGYLSQFPAGGVLAKPPQHPPCKSATIPLMPESGPEAVVPAEFKTFNMEIVNALLPKLKQSK